MKHRPTLRLSDSLTSPCKLLRIAVAIASASISVALVGCSATPQTEPWVLFNNQPTPAAVGKHAKVVIYRKVLTNDTSTGMLNAVNIHVDDDYAASLLPMASTESLLCPGVHRLNATQNVPSIVLGDKTTDAATEQFNAGTVKYFIVQFGEDARPRLFPVAPEQAAKDLAGMRQQVHTLSRVKTPVCA